MAQNTSSPPGVVPTRTLYERPAAGVSASPAAVQLKVAVSPLASVARPVGADGGVLAGPPLLS